MDQAPHERTQVYIVHQDGTSYRLRSHEVRDFAVYCSLAERDLLPQTDKGGASEYVSSADRVACLKSHALRGTECAWTRRQETMVLEEWEADWVRQLRSDRERAFALLRELGLDKPRAPG